MQHAWESRLATSGAVAVENDVGALEPLLANRQPFRFANGTWAGCVWLTGLRTESEENKAFLLATRHDSQPLLPLHVLGRGVRVLDWYQTLVKCGFVHLDVKPLLGVPESHGLLLAFHVAPADLLEIALHAVHKLPQVEISIGDGIQDPRLSRGLLAESWIPIETD